MNAEERLARLWLERAPSTAATFASPPRPVGLLAGVYVLIVEDNEDARDILKTSLERRGALVLTASSANAAVRLLISVAPDVLISDLAMHRRGGLWLIRAVRRLADPYARTPAIAITAYRETQQRKRALAAGFDEYVEKPIELDHFVKLVAAMARRKRERVGTQPARVG